MTQASRSDLPINADDSLKARFTTKVVDKVTELLIDNATGVEYIKLYPTQYRKSNETVTCIPLLDSSGFPSINAEWSENNK